MNANNLRMTSLIPILTVLVGIGAAWTPPARAQCATLPANAVSWWRAEDDARDSADGNHGTLQNGATFAAGKVGRAFSFDGANDYVGLPAINVTNEMTVEAWVNPVSLSDPFGVKAVVTKHNLPDTSRFSFNFGIQSDGRLYFDIPNDPSGLLSGGSTAVSSDHSAPLAQWSHVAVVFDDGTVRLYVNGQESIRTVPVSVVPANGNPANIGVRRQPNGDFFLFNGLIDEVGLFSRALTGPEIQAIYAAGSAGKCLPPPPPCEPVPSGIVSWWRAESAATDFADGNHGTLVNGATFTVGKVGMGFNLDGVDDYVDVGNATSLQFNSGGQDLPFTVEAWIMRADAREPVIAKENFGGDRNWQFTLYDGTVYAAMYQGGPSPRISRTAPDTTSLGNWHHLAMTYDGSETSAGIRIYIDGARVDNGDDNVGSYTGMTNGASVKIGAGPGSGPIYFNGGVDELSIYNRALSAAEVFGVYAAGSAGKCIVPDTDGDGYADDVDNCPTVANADQLDTDNDGAGDACDPDDDNDTVPDAEDAAPLNRFACRDVDGDGCDDCASGVENAADDGIDTDADGICNAGDADDDNDTVPDASDADPLNRFICGDADGDGCDDCGIAGAQDPFNDGTDFDADGFCDFGDLDDDMDGVSDADEIFVYNSDPYNRFSCGDRDGDGCDDCGVSGGPPATASDGADFDADGLCDSGDADDDNDGLPDSQPGASNDEADFGTNPFDSDSDDDGLFDGTEVDSAMGTGCPSPTDDDSDNDTLSDSDECCGGTNPCNADTDGDGLNDNVDPTPTGQGAPPGYIEAQTRDLANVVIPALDLSQFTGPNANANKVRRGALANKAANAANHIAAGNYAQAIAELESLLEKIDGDTPPPDWMDDSQPDTSDIDGDGNTTESARQALEDQVRLLIDLLELLLP